MRLITKLFETQALTYASNNALTFGNQHLSYQQLNQAANRFAAYLLANDIQIEDRIGIAVDRSPQMLIALLGILKAGAAYVPLDPDYPQKRTEYILDDSSAKILLTSKKYKGKFKTAATEILIEDIWPKLSGYPGANIETTVNEHNLVYIIYTSGTTGFPKGVQIEHYNLYNLLISIQKFPGITSEDILLAITTISFDISVLEMFLPLITGAQLVMADSLTAKDGIALLNIIEQQNISFVQATPFTYKMMLEAGWTQKYNLKALCGGEALPKDLAMQLVARCTALYNMYGPTETTIYSTGKQIKATDELITIGWPIDNTTVYILDEDFKQAAPGQSGEICIAGDGVARGYFNKPALTADKFLDNEFNPDAGARIYRTGDLGRILNSGEIQYMGRIDNQIKIKGYRIELDEIEYLLRKQKGVKEAVVISPETADGHTKLVAYVVSHFTENLNAEAKGVIKTWKPALKKLLPDYMVPNDIVLLNDLPLTENGKINRKALVAINSTLNSTDNYEAPTNDLEQLIADIWKEYLHIETVGINDTFFDLGGHSLIAVRIINRIKNETGKRVLLADLLEHDTVKQLALLLQKNEEPTKVKALVTIKPGGNKTPLYLVHGNGSTALKFMSFVHQFDDDQPVYGLQATGFDGDEESFDKIEDIASSYLDEILVQNPVGPYAIAGYSFGGIIAFEMAQQLKALGKTVTLLAMLEGFVVKRYQLEPGLFKDYFNLYSRFRKFMFGFYLLRQEPRRTLTFKMDTIKGKINKQFGKTILHETYKHDELLKTILDVAEVYQTAVENYRLKPYNGDIHVYKAQKRSFFIDDFKYLGWKPYARSVKVFDIQGEHMDIFDPPHNVAFARKLQHDLDKCHREYNKQTSLHLVG